MFIMNCNIHISLLNVASVSQHCFVHPGRVVGPVLRGLLESTELRLSAPAHVLPSPPLPRLGPGAPRPQPAGPLPPPTAVWAWSWWYEGRTGEGRQGRDSHICFNFKKKQKKQTKIFYFEQFVLIRELQTQRQFTCFCRVCRCKEQFGRTSDKKVVDSLHQRTLDWALREMCRSHRGGNKKKRKNTQG